MNWNAIGAIGEVLGASVVLITLVYLAIQVRRSNELAYFNATNEVFKQFNDLNRLVITDTTLRQVLMKTEELTADENEQIYNFAMMFCNVWLSVQIAYDNDQIDKSTYQAGVQDVSIELARWPNFGPAVEQWICNYPEHENHKIMQSIVSGISRNQAGSGSNASDA